MDVKMKDPALVSQDSRACAEIPQTSIKIQIRHYPDVNDDGKSDVLVGNFCVSASNFASGTVNVLLGNGDGTFHAAVGYNSGAQGTVSVAVADVNGDGKPDLIVANFCASNTCTKGSVGVLLSKSTTWTSFISSLNPSIYGQAVTWTATVTSSGSSAPTGK
jgi:VCBS repeat protein